MIVVRLIGGLGNQMFQYAVGRALALRHHTLLKLDVSAFAEYRTHQYALDRLRIVATHAAEEEVRMFSRRGRLERLFARPGWRSGGLNYIKEQSFAFDPSVVRASPPLYLDGYWQSEKYFSAAREVLLSEFKPKNPFNSENLAVCGCMEASESVSVHVRRGDYVSDANASAVHGTCGADYYYRAADHLAKHVGDIRLFVFSDDISWARQNLEFSFPTEFVDVNGRETAEWDMHLMAACRHHIIANSSFSWWAAWLNPRRDKQVVAPARWFRDWRIDTSDLLPESWVRL
jgi:Glycosyl transferase family 11